MDKTKPADWGKLSPARITDTVAYKNAKKIFSSKTDDFCQNIAALAIIEHTYPQGYVCKLSELKQQISEKFGIEKPLEDPLLLTKVFFAESEEERTTTCRWLDILAVESYTNWDYRKPEHFKAEREQALSVNLDKSKVQILKKAMDTNAACILEFQTTDASTGYTYASSLEKDGITPIWISSLNNPHIFAYACASQTGRFLPVINLFDFNPKMHSIVLGKLVKFVLQFGFKIAFVLDKETWHWGTNYKTLFSDSVYLVTETDNLAIKDEDIFCNSFPQFGHLIYNASQQSKIESKTILSMKKPITELLKKSESEEEATETIETLMSALSGKVEKAENLQSNNKDNLYSINVINASVKPNILLKMAQKQRALKQEGKKAGLKFLFSGPSGTGKTAFGYYLSEELDIGLITVKASDILHRLIGGSESNTCELFKRAKAEDKILQIDEVDAFLGRRDDRDPNLRVTATLVNQFLQELEAFDGVFIGTTNVINQIDPAFVRRFTKIVDFKYLSETGIKELLSLYFPDKNFTENQAKQLIYQENIGPGDFGSVYSNTQFMDAEEVTSDYIVDSLISLGDLREKKKTKAIGFSLI